MTTTPDPITTAREALSHIDAAIVRTLSAVDDLSTINSALDLAEKLKAERDGFAATVVSLAEHRDRLTSQLEQAERVVRAQEKALKLHHTWQGSDEPYGLELTPGNWIELNRGAEYADSSMYEVTMEAFRAASQWIKDRQAKTDVAIGDK